MKMKLSEIKEILGATVLCVPERDPEFSSVMGSDMMSDVLAFAEPDCLMVTGLISMQSVRTADIADAAAIVYVRGKSPDKQTIILAVDLDIPLLTTEKGMVDVCGILYSKGLKGVC